MRPLKQVKHHQLSRDSKAGGVSFVAVEDLIVASWVEHPRTVSLTHDGYLQKET